MQQMPLVLKPPRRPSFDNFIQGENEALVQTLQSGLEVAHRYLVMGPKGSGLTHLLSAVFQARIVAGAESVYLSLSDVSLWPLLDQAQASFVVLDDVDQVSGSAEGELALFNALNRWHAAKSTVVMSAVGLSDITLPDLRSRLGQATRLTLKPLNEAGLQALAIRLAYDQDIQLSPEVAQYLVSRTTRNASEMTALMNELMIYALSEKRAITIPVVREHLSHRSESEP